jgi:hypothetical protein
MVAPTRDEDVGPPEPHLQRFARQMIRCDAMRHENLLAGPEGQDARRPRPWHAQEGGGGRLRRLPGHPQAVAEAASPNGLGGAQEEEARDEATHRRQRLPERRAPCGASSRSYPEATLEEHRELWEHERGVRVSVATMSRAIRRLGWTYKQRRWEPPSATRKHGPTGASG